MKLLVESVGGIDGIGAPHAERLSLRRELSLPLRSRYR